MRVPARWLTIGVFIFSSALNYLDRQLLAALAEPVRAEFQWSYEDYGRVLSYFAIVYSIAAPLMGILIDRIGLNAGVSLAVGGWSLATLWTGWSAGVRELVASRLLLGWMQGGGIPASGKAMSTYLEPGERALGNALSNIGISIGLIAAPPLAAYMAPLYGWRSAFWVAGGLGFVWIPLWWLAARRAPVQAAAVVAPRAPIGELLRALPFWGIVAATVLAMTVYSLWTNFTTIYFVKALGMDHVRANRSVAWIPPLLGGFGGLAGGAFSLRMIRAGMAASNARRRAALIGAVLIALTTALVPMSSSPLGAALLISVSYFCASAVSVNLYALPIDIFGPGRAAFNIAALTCAFGFMNYFFLPWVGRIIDTQGFGTVCSVAAGLPLLGIGILHATKER